MNKYRVRYRINGVVVIEAEDSEAAENEFDVMCCESIIAQNIHLDIEIKDIEEV